MTFGFGRTAIAPKGEILDTYDKLIPLLYAAGNSTGGFFYNNCLGGTGLTNALVFVRIAAETVFKYIYAH